MEGVPSVHRWLFWEVDPDALDLERHRDSIIPRVLERGDLEAVRWAIEAYGLGAIHAFLRDVGHPELSPRTLAFWRAKLQAEEEPWASPSGWRTASAAPWVD